MTPVFQLRPLRYRSIWISDVHLGTKHCKAHYLFDFLNAVECDYLYLLGDIVDLWNMKRGLYWPQAHNDVVRIILEKARSGTTVIYVPGNHDHPLREHDGLTFGNVRIRNSHVHTTADGKRLLLMHGDEFDHVVKCGWLSRLIGNQAYDLLLYLSRWVDHVRQRMGLSYWSLAGWLKRHVKGAARHIDIFEQACMHEVERRRVDGVVCGHIHHAEIKRDGRAVYCNDGDWVESCTALVETHDGALELLRWVDRQHTVKSLAPADTDAVRKIA
ncbi:MAG: UDP-2,3-diacylglucosamine diphosphatase [Gammaproteobacteria bacterium]